MKKKNLLMIAIATFGLAAISMAQAPSYVPSIGLVGWWPFNGNANDESGNNNNGTVIGAVLTIDRFGSANNAFSFNGTSDYIRCINAGPTGNPNITLSFWVKTSQTTASDIFNWGNGTIAGQDFRACFNEAGCAGVTFDNYNSAITYSTTTDNNTWEHYVVVYDSIVGSSVLSSRAYKNGILLSSVCFTQNFDQTNIGSANPITIGRYNKLTSTPQAPNYFSGTLDDIGIWNRVLTQQEITNLYNAANCSNNTAITPQTNSLATGSTATFTASTTDPNPTYVWQSDLGQGFQTLNNFGNYSGVNTASLNVTNVQLSEHNQPLRVISTSGNCIDTSNVAVINILDTCITNVTIYDTILTTVTDTLIINATITGLNPPSNQNTLKVFPNPANTHITIDYGNFSSMNGYTLKIVNATGQTVFTTFINQQNSYIDLSTWTGNGIYYVQLIDTQNNTIENRKIVIH